MQIYAYMCICVYNMCIYVCMYIYTHTTGLTDRPNEQMIWANKFSSGL